MTDQPKDAFTIWGNFNKNKDKEGHYWARIEIPLTELASLLTWAKTAERCQNQKGEDCLLLRANLMPRTSKNNNDYFLMAMSDAKPKVDDAPF
jgi:hypothetical protein|tara:strand:+ start:589 stop:867 length:279 start_codon:yes stop_codon:yes gene_type:complete